MNIHSLIVPAYSKSVWNMLLLQNNVDRPRHGLASEIDWVTVHRSGDSRSSRVYKLSMAAAFYGVWRERNGRQFQGLSFPASSLGAQIIGDVRACLNSWRGLKANDS